MCSQRIARFACLALCHARRRAAARPRSTAVRANSSASPRIGTPAPPQLARSKAKGITAYPKAPTIRRFSLEVSSPPVAQIDFPGGIDYGFNQFFEDVPHELKRVDSRTVTQDQPKLSLNAAVMMFQDLN
jgi:hypothetical protein